MGRCRPWPRRRSRRSPRRAGRHGAVGGRQGLALREVHRGAPAGVLAGRRRPAPGARRRADVDHPPLPGVVRRRVAGAVPQRARQRRVPPRPRAALARRHGDRRAHARRPSALAAASDHRPPRVVRGRRPGERRRPVTAQRRPDGDGRAHPGRLAARRPQGARPGDAAASRRSGAGPPSEAIATPTPASTPPATSVADPVSEARRRGGARSTALWSAGSSVVQCTLCSPCSSVASAQRARPVYSWRSASHAENSPSASNSWPSQPWLTMSCTARSRS